jgi:hypothetical protein
MGESGSSHENWQSVLMYIMLSVFGFICVACCAYGLLAECMDRSKKKKKRAKRKIKEKKEL